MIRPKHKVGHVGAPRAAMLVVVGIAIAVAFAAGRLRTDDTQWRTAQEPHFSVSVPTSLAVLQEPQAAAARNGYSNSAMYMGMISGHRIIIGESIFADSTDISDPQKILDAMIKPARDNPNLDVTKHAERDFKGYPARLVFDHDKSGLLWTKTLILFVNTPPARVYTINEVASDGKFDDAVFQKIIDSFAAN